MAEHDGTVPADLAAALRSVVSAVHHGGRALLALDFDGVLAPLQDDPELSRALPESAAALRRLAEVPGVTLALVSGRAVGDLAAKADVPDGTWLVGSHGAERGRWTPEGLDRVPLAVPPEAQALLSTLRAELEAAVDGTTGRLERKPASVVLHTRTAARDDAERLTALALGLGSRPGVDAIHGKDVVELAVLRVTKGDALEALRTEIDADVLLYAGDDVTDERAFAVLRPDDVTVRVGPGETAARFRVADPHAMATVLAGLADGLASPG